MLQTVLQGVLQLYMETGLGLPPTNDAVETLIAASKFGKMCDKQYLLTLATKLQTNPEHGYLRAAIAHRQSVLLRFNGDISGSQRIVQEFFDQQCPEPNPRLHSFHGLLRLSQAENLAYHLEHPMAYKEAQKWELLNNSPSLMELYVLRSKQRALGQSYKGDGYFEAAKSCFEACLQATQDTESNRFLTESQLADVYCELHHHERHCLNKEDELMAPEPVYLDKAEEILKPEIERLMVHGRHLRHFRRLLLSLIEVYIIRGRFSEAESLIKELLFIYNRLSEPDINDQFGHVRALIAWARIALAPEAVERWNAVLDQHNMYKFEEDMFGCGVVHLFISFEHFQSQDVSRSKAAFDHAVEICSRKRPQFLIPGLGTYLFYSIRAKLQSVAGWQW